MTDTKAPPAIDRDDGWHLEPAGRRNGASWRAGIDATGAWRQLMEVAGAGVARGGRGVRVVVLDTGMDVDHPALKHAVVRELARDFDHSADRDGRSLADGGRVHNRYDAHGTACAGIIAAHDPENSQIAGIAPGCTIVPVRISNNFDPNALVHAVNYARQKGDVILLPRAMPEWIEPAGAGGQPAVLTEQESQWKSELDRLRQALTDAAKEVPVVCPSGNNGTKQIGYPASIPGMIVVGACNELGYRSTYSQYGEGLDIVAPSNDVATEDRSIVRLTRAEAFRRFEERETEAVEQEVAESLAGLSRPRPAQAAAPETRGLSEAKAPPYRAAETGDRDPGVQAEQAFADVYERSLEGLAEIEADLDGLRQRREDFLAAHGVDRLGTLFIATTDNSGASGYLPDGKDDYLHAGGPFGFGGTSAASAQVAGIVALMLSARRAKGLGPLDPSRAYGDAAMVKRLLRQAASRDHLLAEGERRDAEGDVAKADSEPRGAEFGAGLVDAAKAVRLVLDDGAIKTVAQSIAAAEAAA